MPPSVLSRADLRRAILRAPRGVSARSLARRLRCSDRTVRLWRQRGSPEPRGRPGPKPKLSGDHLMEVAERLRTQGSGDVGPDALALACGVSVPTVYRVVRRFELRARLGWDARGRQATNRACVFCYRTTGGRTLGRPVRNGSYRTRGGRRRQWRCLACGRTPRAGTVYYRRKWREALVLTIVDVFTWVARDQRDEVIRDLARALGIRPSSLRRAYGGLRRPRWRDIWHRSIPERLRCVGEVNRLLNSLDGLAADIVVDPHGEGRRPGEKPAGRWG